MIPPGGVSDASWYHGDVPATAAELAGAERPDGASGDSFVAAMKGTAEAKPWTRKSPLYWECYEGAGGQAVRFGKWPGELIHHHSPAPTSHFQQCVATEPAGLRQPGLQPPFADRHPPAASGVREG